MSGSDVADLRGKEFERVDMTGARFTTVSLNGATFRPRPGVPHDRDARPSLDEALALRLKAMALMRVPAGRTRARPSPSAGAC